MSSESLYWILKNIELSLLLLDYLKWVEICIVAVIRPNTKEFETLEHVHVFWKWIIKSDKIVTVDVRD